MTFKPLLSCILLAVILSCSSVRHTSDPGRESVVLRYENLPAGEAISQVKFHFEEEDREPLTVVLSRVHAVKSSEQYSLSGVAGDALELMVTDTLQHEQSHAVIRSQLTLRALRDVSFILSQVISFIPRSRPVFLCPGYLYHTNNAANAWGKFPQFVYQGEVGIPQSSLFYFRADRSSHGVVMAMFDDQVLALGIREGIRINGRHHYNGLGIDTSRKSHDELAVTIGYKNLPARYNGNCSPRISPRWDEEPEYAWVQLKKGETIQVEILRYQGRGRGAFAYEKPLRVYYDFLRDQTRQREDPRHVARLIADAIVEDAVVEDCGLFRVTDTSNECNIGWTGGMMVAGPLLAYGKRSGDQASVNAALRAMDSLMRDGFNPDASLFYDTCRDGVWTVDGWWRNWAGGHHLAYTNGQAVYFILEAWEQLSPQEKAERGSWLESCRAVVETALKHQRETGEFPASYSPQDGSPGTIQGFGGCWFLPALLKAYQHFHDESYLDAAIAAERFYFDWLRTLEVWGTPIDAEGAVELEGNLALVKGERLLYEITQQPVYLKHLEHAINYDLSWKWAYNTHFENPPLKDLNWRSQGGNGASTSNIHLHPMSNMILDDLWFLCEKTGDEYYGMRYRDSFHFGLECINLVDEEFGFGKAGWGTEQFFHTDALQGQKPRDGGIWTRYLCWATSSVLHSIVTAPEEYVPHW